MGKVKSLYSKEDHSEPMGGLCDGDCNKYYYMKDLNKTYNKKWYCSRCMYLFIKEEEAINKIEDYNE